MGSAAAPQRPLGAAPPGKMAAGALWGEAGWGGGARRLPAGGRRRSPPRAGPLQLRPPSLLLSRARAALSQPTIRFATVGRGPLVWGFTFDCGGLLLVLVWVLFWGFFCGGFFSRFLTASFLGVVFFHVSSQPLTPEISGEGKCLKFRNSMQCLWACPAGPRRAPQREKPGRAAAITRAG